MDLCGRLGGGAGDGLGGDCLDDTDGDGLPKIEGKFRKFVTNFTKSGDQITKSSDTFFSSLPHVTDGEATEGREV